MDFTYKWNLTDLKNVKKNGLKVFSCFSCGGGSTMGYKMAGFDVIGCNEIDSKMMSVYRANHNPKFPFLESIETFKNRTDLPKELYNLDILDGSPPCSSFSMAGSREKTWGKKKKFREGQEKQILDDLFFHFIELAHKLQPKVIIAENVKGMLAGNAKGYIKEIRQLFETSGYNVQLFLLNASSMGVPQKRERIFFVCSRKDLNLGKLNLLFNERQIKFSEIDKDYKGKQLSETMMKCWKWCKENDKNCFSEAAEKLFGKCNYFNHKFLFPSRTANTITAQCSLTHNKYPLYLSRKELSLIGSYPLDYNFLKIKPDYLIGMSVPPLMTYKLVKKIETQWFNQN